jgi:trehalose 6-phosphate synthase/phosphatase
MPHTRDGAVQPLVMVSNRLPFQVHRDGKGYRYGRAPGGLVTALDAALAERGGVWIGWPGLERHADDPPLVLPETPGVRYRAVDLTSREVSLYYGGFVNRTLWPLFHYFVARTRIDGATWRAYQRINARFAEAASDAAPSDSLMWVHDYQLMLVPALLRSHSPRRRIAFFLHIPFPAADVLRVLPWSRAVMRGLLGADLVGFQIGEHAEHFLICAERLLGCEVDRTRGLVHWEGRDVAVQSHPVSIDAAQMERLALRAQPPVEGAPLAILGVDRLDYTKGIAERLLALEKLLERHGEWRRRVVFTQIVVPSRERVAEYQELKRSIDEIVGRVNGRFSDRGWAPINYLTRSYPPEELAGMYRAADVALVTPLRDGMNLVAKEYVAAQVDGNGVLVLSELAGAASELPEALIVNPYDIDAMADTIHRALAMPIEERRARMGALRDRVATNDAGLWLSRFLAAAAAAAPRQPGTPAPVELVRRRLEPWLGERLSVALFLDYDGTLTPIAATPAEAVLSEASRRLLEQTVGAPHLDVTIVSGRSLEDLRAMVGVDGLTYVGDHGYRIEGPGLSFRHEAWDRWQSALDSAAAELEALGIEGAMVERKGASVACHVRGVPREQLATAERRAEAVLRRRKLEVMAGKAVLEGRPPLEWDKGQAVLQVLERRHGAQWPARVRALYVGDDVTDEDAFRALRGIGRSILVLAGGTSASGADFTLPSPEEVLQVVRWLAAGLTRPSD